ncbi:hypothetical protein H6G91_13495 [Nostoc muscorum FACHB-395]|nr:hypothetical protein [Desmonostoc muscorum FACHB-395]
MNRTAIAVTNTSRANTLKVVFKAIRRDRIKVEVRSRFTMLVYISSNSPK